MWRISSLLPLILGFAEVVNFSTATTARPNGSNVTTPPTTPTAHFGVTTQATPYFNVPLSFGDIFISSTSDVVISLGPDGRSDPKMMAYICAESYDSMSRVVSRQLGYLETACSLTRKTMDYSNSLIQLSIKCNCTGSESHILRCCTVPQVFEKSSPCNNTLMIRGPCADGKSLYRLQNRKNKGNHAYPGEVLLFPPAVGSGDFGHVSPSMGLVAVRKEQKDCPEWRFVYKDNYAVDHSIASTFCRQMGYTDVVSRSIMTRREYEDFFQLYFTYWDTEITDPYLPLSNISCQSPQTCLACCSYPHNEGCNSPGLLPGSSYDNILVIRCTFYLEEKLAPSGSKKSCQFNNGKHTSLCKSSITMNTTDFIAAIAVPIGFLLVVCIVLIVICILLCLKCQCQKRCQRNKPNGYKPIEGDNNNGNNN